MNCPRCGGRLSTNAVLGRLCPACLLERAFQPSNVASTFTTSNVLAETSGAMLYLADELFFTGTATEVAAIRSVDAIQIGNGKRGPITAKIANAYFGLVQGKTEDKYGWLDYVDMNAPRAAVVG